MLKNITTIILDIGGTLSEEISWLKITESLNASVDKHEKIFKKMKTGELTYQNAKAKLIKLWQKTGKANRSNMKDIFNSWHLRNEAPSVIRYLQNKYRICLISGSMDLYVEIIANKLGVKDYYANTELIWDNDGTLVDFNYFVNQSAKKLEQFEEFIEKNEIEESGCVVIGDGDNDMGLFERLENGIAVINDVGDNIKKVQKLAKIKVKRLSELRKIL